MRVAKPPEAAKRFTYEIAHDGMQLEITMTFPSATAAAVMADWIDDVLCDAGIEAHERELDEEDED